MKACFGTEWARASPRVPRQGLDLSDGSAAQVFCKKVGDLGCIGSLTLRQPVVTSARGGLQVVAEDTKRGPARAGGSERGGACRHCGPQPALGRASDVVETSRGRLRASVPAVLASRCNGKGALLPRCIKSRRGWCPGTHQSADQEHVCSAGNLTRGRAYIVGVRTLISLWSSIPRSEAGTSYVRPFR